MNIIAEYDSLGNLIHYKNNESVHNVHEDTIQKMKKHWEELTEEDFA